VSKSWAWRRSRQWSGVNSVRRTKSVVSRQTGSWANATGTSPSLLGSVTEASTIAAALQNALGQFKPLRRNQLSTPRRACTLG